MEQQCRFCKKPIKYIHWRTFAQHCGTCDSNPNAIIGRKKMAQKRTLPRDKQTKTCPRCDKKFIVFKLKSEFTQKFCSIYCAHSRTPNKKTKLKTSLSMKEYYKDPKHREAASLRQTGKMLTTETKQKIKNARLLQIIPFKDTKIEKMVQLELQRRDIKFIKHAPLLGQPDIFIEPNICVFVDGDYWHANPSIYKSNKRMSGKLNILAKDIWKKDLQINNYLKLKKYKVLRFWETDIIKNINNIGNIIEKEFKAPLVQQ